MGCPQGGLFRQVSIQIKHGFVLYWEINSISKDRLCVTNDVKSQEAAKEATPGVK